MSKRQLLAGVKLARGESNWYRCSPYTQQIAWSLAVYHNRGEWNGSVISAIECLELAGYEIKLKGRVA